MCMQWSAKTEYIYETAGTSDLYYQRLQEKVKIVLMECCTGGWDTCFCVSMQANKTDELQSLAVRRLDNEVLVEVKDE